MRHVFQACRELARPGYRTRNGREFFVVMTVEELDVLRLEAARAQLYRDMDKAEDDFAHGRMMEAAEPRLARMGHRKYLLMRHMALHRVEDHTVKVGGIFHTAQNYARLV